MRNIQNIGYKLVLAGLAGVVVVVALSMPRYVHQFHSAHWPSTTGVILETNLGLDGYHKGMPRYFPELKYSYNVEAQAYTGTRIDFLRQYQQYPPDVAMSWLLAYPPGQTVTVYYDPQKPNTAVLEPGIKSEQRGLFYIGLGAIVLCSFFFVVVLYDYHNGRMLPRYFVKVP